MADRKTNNQVMWGGIGVVVAVIMFANMSAGGTASGPHVAMADTVAPTLAPPNPDSRNTARDDKVLSRSGEPSVITYKSGEDKIDQSIADARKHLDYFWARFNAPAADEKMFTLKVAVPVKRGADTGREHIWVLDVRREGKGFTGRLDNDPVDMAGAKAGDRIPFTADMVSDWGFSRRGKMIGFYSTRVMLDDAPPREAAAIRSMLGENPA